MQEKDLKKTMQYKRILNKNTRYINFYEPAEFMLKNIPYDMSDDNYIIYKTTVLITAPTLISYILYILDDAQKQKISRLYFLSRDGYIMHKIALILCEKYSINIECRYLYCSRMALRAPLYLIDKEEAMERFCAEGVKISPRVVLQRAGINGEIQNKILNELNIDFRDKPLNSDELKLFGEQLRGNLCFTKEAYNYAESNYNNVYQYFIQEGLIQDKNYAIVDTGWIGSMQRHIRQILSYSGNKKNLKGYYFGMFDNGKSEDGDYNCFYFSKENNSLRRVLFNNNVFECMCSANHGMTIGYNKNNKNIIKPAFKEYKEKWNVNLQLNVIKEFTKIFSKKNQWGDIKFNSLPQVIKKSLISFMIFPSKEEANLYGRIPFCDDSTENYMLNLADKLTKDELREYSLAYKIYKKVFLKKRKGKFHESFWINGTIQLSDISYKKLFNLQCILSEYIHYLRIRN